MLDLEEILKRIETEKSGDLTTKELKVYGLNKYYIKKAVDNGKLLKVTRGVYKIAKKELVRKRWETFNEFVRCTLSNDFENANQALLANLESQIDHSYDNHLRTYFILLAKILGNDMEKVKQTEQVLEFSETGMEKNTYYADYVKFREAVFCYDFDRAFTYIDKYRRAEKARNGENNISTRLFYHLTKTIVLNEQQAKYKNNRRMYQAFFRSFMAAYQKEEYEYAVQLLKETLPYSPEKNKTKLQNLIRLLTSYVKLVNSDDILIEKALDYKDLESNTKDIVMYALENEDYLKAYQNIGKWVYEETENTILKLYQEILRKIIEQNRKNMEINKKRVISSDKSDEVTESLDCGISQHQIYELVYQRKYQQLESLLSQLLNQSQDDKTYFFVLKMIRDKNNISQVMKTFDSEKIIYSSSQDDIFKRFFEALRYKDYTSAYSFVKKCEDVIKRRGSSDLEFTIYRYMIEDILEEIEKYNENLEIYTVQKQIDPYLASDDLSQEKLMELHSLLSREMELLSEKQTGVVEENDSVYMAYAIELIEMCELISKNHLSADYFEKFLYEEKDLVTVFMKAMSLGDYLTASEIIFNDDWLKETKNHLQKKYFIFYKKMLSKMTREFKKQEKIVYSNKEDILEESSPAELVHLSRLKNLIKKRDYTNAYQYYQQYLGKNSSLELKEILDVLLTFVMQVQLSESEENLIQYCLAFDRGDFSKAKSFLDKYKESIQDNGLNRNIDYHYLRIQSMLSEISSSSFVEKEQLYDYAKYLINNKKYQECVEILNEYITMDQDLSAKGYLLRGRALEYLRCFDDAMDDYRKAIDIIPEPNAYYRLGKVCLYQKDYSGAIENLLEYEARRPQRDVRNLLALRDAYKIVGDSENYEKYNYLATQANKALKLKKKSS